MITTAEELDLHGWLRAGESEAPIVDLLDHCRAHPWKQDCHGADAYNTILTIGCEVNAWYSASSCSRLVAVTIKVMLR
jgi:hypothetical protein